MKKQHDEEKEKRREAAREKKRQELAKGIQGLVSNAETKQAEHQEMEVDGVHEKIKAALGKQENSLKAYYKEFKKVIDAADVILEVVDARDPLGTRCKEVKLNSLLQLVNTLPDSNQLMVF